MRGVGWGEVGAGPERPAGALGKALDVCAQDGGLSPEAHRAPGSAVPDRGQSHSAEAIACVRRPSPIPGQSWPSSPTAGQAAAACFPDMTGESPRVTAVVCAKGQTGTRHPEPGRLQGRGPLPPNSLPSWAKVGAQRGGPTGGRGAGSWQGRAGGSGEGAGPWLIPG